MALIRKAIRRVFYPHPDTLAYTIELARQYALQRNREWGMYVRPDAVEFAEFDPEQQTWVTQAGRPFGNVEPLPNVEFRVESEALDRHENLGEGGWMWPTGVAVLLGLTFVRAPKVRLPAGLLALAAAVGVASWAALAGHTGGALVYEHGLGVPARSP